MTEGPLKPAQVLAESNTDDPVEFVRLGVDAAKAGEYERGLIFLTEAYNRLRQRITTWGENAVGEPVAPPREVVPAIALSYYGLCLALHKGRYREGARFCELAIKAERFEGDHYLNLARIWNAVDNRKNTVDAIDRGLVIAPRDLALLKLRDEVGMRSQPVLPFLTREDPLNKALGKLRHLLKTKKTPKTRRVAKATSGEVRQPR